MFQRHPELRVHSLHAGGHVQGCQGAGKIRVLMVTKIRSQPLRERVAMRVRSWTHLYCLLCVLGKHECPRRVRRQRVTWSLVPRHPSEGSLLEASAYVLFQNQESLGARSFLRSRVEMVSPPFFIASAAG